MTKCYWTTRCASSNARTAPVSTRSSRFGKECCTCSRSVSDDCAPPRALSTRWARFSVGIWSAELLCRRVRVAASSLLFLDGLSDLEQVFDVQTQELPNARKPFCREVIRGVRFSDVASHFDASRAHETSAVKQVLERAEPRAQLWPAHERHQPGIGLGRLEAERRRVLRDERREFGA